MRWSHGVLFLLALTCTACAHCHRELPGRPDLPEDPGGPLPEGKDALLRESDGMAAQGPSGPNLVRSYRAAERCLIEHSPACEYDALWRMARGLYLMTLTASTSKDAGRLAEYCMKLDFGVEPPAEADFYLALCMGARALAKKTKALQLIPKMVEHGEKALAKDRGIANAGPHRLLGGVYLRAPAWPLSVGDLDEALVHLEKATKLGPNWAENHLMLAEALLEDDRKEEAKAALARARELLDEPISEGWRKIWREDADVIEKQLSP